MGREDTMPKGRDYPVRELRERLGMTQLDFAKTVGVGLTTVARWEQGKAKPTPLAIEKLESLARRVGKEKAAA